MLQAPEKQGDFEEFLWLLITNKWEMKLYFRSWIFVFLSFLLKSMSSLSFFEKLCLMFISGFLIGRVQAKLKQQIIYLLRLVSTIL